MNPCGNPERMKGYVHLESVDGQVSYVKGSGEDYR